MSHGNMSIVSVANQFYRQVKIAMGDNYRKLLKVQELAQAASIDPYDEYSPEEIKSLQDLLKTISILTDKAYRTGVDAPHIKYFVDAAKSQLLKLVMLSSSEVVKKELTGLLNAIGEVQMVDIPGQMSGNMAQVMSEDTIKSTPQEKEEEVKGLTPELEQVVNNLSRTDRYDFNNRPVRW